MSELLKDLEEILKDCYVSPHYHMKKVICKGCPSEGVVADAFGQPLVHSGTSCKKHILPPVAARLAELGYVKAVRCGECRLQHSPYCYYEGFDDKGYCPEGERVVAKDATGEEEK